MFGSGSKWGKWLCMFVCAGLLAGCLSGCGGRYAGVAQGDGVSGSAVSGSAVSGGGVSGNAVSGLTADDGRDGFTIRTKQKEDGGRHPFCTDTNLYYVENDDSTVMQMKLDGTDKVCLVKAAESTAFVEIYYVDENWLYYGIQAFALWEIYRIPIHKDADGYDTADASEQEKVISDSGMYGDIYIDSDYLIYAARSDNADKLVKYDLQKKKEVSSLEQMDAGYTSVYRVNNRYIFVTMNGDFLVQDIQAEGWDKIRGDEGFLHNSSAASGDALFYAEYLTEKVSDFTFRIQRCDGKKISTFATWEQLKESVLEAENLNPDELDFAAPHYMFWEEGRLYIQLMTGWEKDGVYHMDYMLLSKGEDSFGFRYEKELTECMQSHVKSRTGKWVDRDAEPEKVYVDPMVVNDAHCIAMVDGRAYLCLYDYENNKGRLGCYELDTGKFQWVGREDLLFYELSYSTDFESVYEKADENEENLFLGNTGEWVAPSKDENEYGMFWED